jgi:hypothetical protein
MRRMVTPMRIMVAIGLAAGVVTIAPAVQAGEYYPTPDEKREYPPKCPQCATCPACPAATVAEETEEDTTMFRAELRGGALLGVGNTGHRIDWGGMVEPTFGVKLSDHIDLEVSYLWANNGVSNPGHRSGSMNMHCVRGGPRLGAELVGPVEAYGSFKVGYCNTDGVGTGFSDDNLVVGPGGGIAIEVADHFAVTAGTDLLWFTRGGRENTVITPNAGLRFEF